MAADFFPAKRNAICLALACLLSAACWGAPQAAAQETQRFKVLRAGRLVAPSESVTNDHARCAIAGASDEATMKCQPAAATQSSSYHYHTALVVDAQGTAYVIACRISLVTNFWCKGFAPGTAFQGRVGQENLAIGEGDKSHEYKLLTSAYVGALPGGAPAAPAPSSLSAVGGAASRAPVAAAPESNLKDAGAADGGASCAPAAGACVTLVSEPAGAEIYVDGKFAGSTPSMLNLPAGAHAIRIASEHFKPWMRTLETSAGSKITIRAPLEAAAPSQ